MTDSSITYPPSTYPTLANAQAYTSIPTAAGLLIHDSLANMDKWHRNSHPNRIPIDGALRVCLKSKKVY